jgi:hypothetical protein
MVYRDTEFAPSGVVVLSQTFRLEYVDSRHYKNTLVTHSGRPEAVGWTHVVDGTRSSTTDPRLGTVSVATWKPEERVLPNYWLRPGPRPWIAFRPGATISDVSQDVARATSRAVIDGVEEVEEVTYRIADGIPTEYVRRVGGVEVRRVSVLDLRVGR